MKKFKIGLQLYSVREEMEKDFEGTLQKVKDMGYDYVEFAGYFDHSAEEVKKILDKIGLSAISVHQTYNVFLENPEESVDFLKTIGVKYCAIPWMGKEQHKGTEIYEQTVSDIKKASEALKANGIELLYHNHDFEFDKFEDKYLLDYLLEDTKGYMMPELDTCWVKYAGADVCEYMRKFKGKLPVVHLKDFVCKNLADGPVYALIDENGKEIKDLSREEKGFEFKPVGQGCQNFDEILKTAEECDSEYLIVEQDNFTDIAPLEAVSQSRKYLKDRYSL